MPFSPRILRGRARRGQAQKTGRAVRRGPGNTRTGPLGFGVGGRTSAESSARPSSTQEVPMIVTLVRWLGRGAARAVGQWLIGSSQEPTAEDDRGAGI